MSSMSLFIMATAGTKCIDENDTVGKIQQSVHGYDDSSDVNDASSPNNEVEAPNDALCVNTARTRNNLWPIR
jgi:hypothetical protein